MTQVLIVEDNLVLLETIALDLEMRGYSVRQASNGRSALNILLASQTPPDIIVSDISMPDIDGCRLLEHVRSDPRWTGIPFLFMTAFNTASAQRTSKELGADDYIVKPFHADELVVAIESRLSRIRALQAQAERRLDNARRDLLQMLSHELRTPLTAIYGGSELLADMIDTAQDKQAGRMISLIISGANRLNRFTSKALALLEADSGSLQQLYRQSRQPCQANDLVLAAITSLNRENLPNERQVNIAYTPFSASCAVLGLGEYLALAIEEVLRNAITFSPCGGTVFISVAAGPQTIDIAVADEGPGIASKDLPMVWERFRQIDRAQHEQQGSGLGLAIVRDIVQIHHGSAAISSVPGKGTCVTLTLPRTHEE
jgi:signal transduction histidine kinase